MDERQSKSLVMVMSGGIGGIGLYWSASALGQVDNVNAIVACILSAIVAIITIIAFLVDSRRLIYISFLGTIGYGTNWVIGLSYAILIDYDIADYIPLGKVLGFRREHLTLCAIMTILCVASSAFHYTAGALND